MYKLKNIVRVYGTIYRVSPVTIRFQLLPEAVLFFFSSESNPCCGVWGGVVMVLPTMAYAGRLSSKAKGSYFWASGI